MVVASFAGWIGWWLGDLIGIMTAVVVSMIFTGLGIYLGRRLVEF